jgi:hypothetical protein
LYPQASSLIQLHDFLLWEPLPTRFLFANFLDSQSCSR